MWVVRGSHRVVMNCIIENKVQHSQLLCNVVKAKKMTPKDMLKGQDIRQETVCCFHGGRQLSGNRMKHYGIALAAPFFLRLDTTLLYLVPASRVTRKNVLL